MPAPLDILVVHLELPLHDRTSASLRLRRLLELLVADGHRLTYLACAGAGQDRYAAELERMGVDVVPVDPERLAELGGRSGEPPLDLAALLERGRFDVAVLSFFHMAELYLDRIRRHSPATRIVVDTVDVHFVRELRGAEVSGDPAERAAAERTRERERAVYGAADALIAVSEEDAEALRGLVPDVPVTVVSNVHGGEGDAAPDPAGRSGLVFVGYFGHAPNVDAVLDFHRRTWPLVRRALPGIRLTLIGPDPTPQVAALAGPDVVVTGWVEDTAAYLDAARVSIAPLRFGAGVKGKIGEALGRGLPVVTTSVGAEGMGLVDGEDVLVADDPQGFADAVVRLHRDDDLWRRLSAAGRARLEQGPLSASAARAGLRSLLGPLARTTFFARVASNEPLDAVLGGYIGAFAPSDPVTLVLGTDEDPPALAAAHGAAGDALGRLGRDPAAIPDVLVSAWGERRPLPRTTVVVGAGVEAGAPPERWRAAAEDAAAGRERLRVSRPAPRAAVLLLDPGGPEHVRERLAALAEGGLSGDVEVLAAVRGAEPAVEAVLADAGVRGQRPTGAPAGRRAALRRAAAATTAPVVVALGPHARPRRGFLEPLLEAIRAGAALAAPVVAGAHGLRVAADGSLWPRPEHADGAPEALAWDCVAAATSLWARLPELPLREGHSEARLGAWAREAGPIAVAGAARVDRTAPPPASVIVCTRNRAEELPDCVALLVASGVVHAGGEVVIVDNASTDDTAAVAAALAAEHGPGVRVVHEPRGGLCHARNAGAAAAANDLLLYIDDDARPAPGWYEAVTAALAEPGVVNVGGPIAALWPATRPAGWPEPGLESYLSVLDLGDADLDIAVPEVVYGANWAVRRGALQAVGGFDPDFGPGPDARINGDEVSVAWRLHKAGAGRTRYVAAGAVGHRIPTSRVDDGFLLERALCAGVEQPRHAAAIGDADAQALVGTATGAAGDLLALTPLTGELTVEDVLRMIAAAPAAQRVRMLAAFSLGRLAGAAALLGEDAVEVGSLRLAVRSEHLRGVLAAGR